MWCYHPSTVGSSIIYQSLIKPYVSSHVDQIDSALKKATDAAKAATSKAE